MTPTGTVSTWNLTPREAEVMTAVVQLGSQKAACRQLGIELKTVHFHCHNARLKIGGAGGLGPYIKWDRWRRGGQT
jgi:DNA-binding CsgD family transcriptional regulator